MMPTDQHKRLLSENTRKLTLQVAKCDAFKSRQRRSLGPKSIKIIGSRVSAGRPWGNSQNSLRPPKEFDEVNQSPIGCCQSWRRGKPRTRSCNFLISLVCSIHKIEMYWQRGWRGRNDKIWCWALQTRHPLTSGDMYMRISNISGLEMGLRLNFG